MKLTGLVRKIDELGRTVLPVELRRTLDISAGDALEYHTEGDSAVLRKHKPRCTFCNGEGETVEFEGKRVCYNCLREIAKNEQ